MDCTTPHCPNRPEIGPLCPVCSRWMRLALRKWPMRAGTARMIAPTERQVETDEQGTDREKGSPRVHDSSATAVSERLSLIPQR